MSSKANNGQNSTFFQTGYLRSTVCAQQNGELSVESTCQRILHILVSISRNWSDWSGVCSVEVLGATCRQNIQRGLRKRFFFQIPNYVTPSQGISQCFNKEINQMFVDHMLIISFITVDLRCQVWTYFWLKQTEWLPQCQHVNMHVWLFFR